MPLADFLKDSEVTRCQENETDCVDRTTAFVGNKASHFTAHVKFRSVINLREICQQHSMRDD